VNIKQIIKTLTAEDTTGNTKAIIEHLGFDNVTFFSWSAGAGRLPGSSFSGKAFLKIGGAKKGICKMLETESAVFKAPRFTPASACSATFINLHIAKAYNELANVLKSFSPQAAAVMYMPLVPPSPEGEPGLELKRDIIDYLGSEIVIAQNVRKPFSLGSPPTESLIAVSVNNRKDLVRSLSLLHSKLLAVNKPEARRELLGHTLYLVKLGGLPFFTAGKTPMQTPSTTTPPQVPTMAFTVTDTHLIFGVEAVVERAIRALSSEGTSSLSSAKWFAAAKSAIPSAVGIAGLQDTAASWELIWWMIKESSKNKSQDSGVPLGLSISPSGGLAFTKTELDFSLLPEFEVVRKYFGLSTFYGVSRADGFFFEFKCLGSPGSD
jgi:hypothetical protein